MHHLAKQRPDELVRCKAYGRIENSTSMLSPFSVEAGSMAKSAGGKTTSPKAATAASKVLQDGRTGPASKTAAGSALSQAKSKPKPKGE